MPACARISMAFALALLALASCQSREDRERALTDQCKQEAPCKKQGLCTGRCAPEPCVCVVGGAADCTQSESCASTGQCTAKDGKCVVASNDDCVRATPCKSAGLCTAKEGLCVVGSDSDCQQSELCKNQHKCAAKSSACIDASFSPALLNPALTNEQAPDKFRVKFTTTRGDFVVEVTRAWAPLGAERLYNLVKIGYFTDNAFYKVDGSTAEFGIHGNPEVSAAWHEAMVRDEPPKQPNERGYVAFAKSRPNSRWAPLVIHLKNNRDLDQVGYTPIGRVTQGMNVVDALSRARGADSNAANPDAVKLQTGGNVYLKASFPQLDYVTSAALL
jgi:peptidyl-prolyl cis-trans isomerase A (cyclophilin A)